MIREYRLFLKAARKEAAKIGVKVKFSPEALAVALTTAGLNRAAERAILDAMDREPTPSVQLNAAIIRARLGNYGGAVDLLATAVERRPDPSLCSALIEYAEMSGDNQALARAKEVIQKVDADAATSISSLGVSSQPDFNGISRISRAFYSLQARLHWQSEQAAADAREALGLVRSQMNPAWRKLFEALHFRDGRLGPAAIEACDTIAPNLLAELLRCARDFGSINVKQVLVASVVYNKRLTLVCRVENGKFVKATWTSDEYTLRIISQEHIALDRLSGLNVPDYVTHRSFQDKYIIVVSFIEGATLAKLHYKPRRSFWGACEKLLSAIHLRGVAHGDISPHNIIESDGCPYFIDLADASLSPSESEFARDKNALKQVQYAVQKSTRIKLENFRKPSHFKRGLPLKSGPP